MSLERIPSPPARLVKACESCAGMAAECLVPVGDGAAECCWYCAHMISAHETTLEGAVGAKCDCSLAEVYPADVLAARPLPVGCPECGAVSTSHAYWCESGGMLRRAGEDAHGVKPTKVPEAQTNRVDRIVRFGYQRKLGIRQT